MYIHQEGLTAFKSDQILNELMIKREMITNSFSPLEKIKLTKNIVLN